MIHEQVQKQLKYLKMLVDGEIENERRCKEWGIKYTPSRRKWKDIELYEDYKNEIEKNGDKNLLLTVKMNGVDAINMYGIYPFARRYVHEPYLIHRTEHGTEILFREDEIQITNK